MNYPRGILLPALVTTVLMVPVSSFSDVKIVLKNGNEMTADNCREEANSYVCSMMDGTFELQKGDVKTIRGVTSGTRNVQPDPAAAGEADKDQSAPPKTGADARKEPGEPAARDAAVKGTGNEAEKRLELITRRKQELAADREKLMKENEKLREDLKNTPFPTQAQANELNRRGAEMSERINKFNEEVKRLNEEEKKLLERVK